MNSDDLRALLDAAGKATPGRWRAGNVIPDPSLSLDAVAALARIALAAKGMADAGNALSMAMKFALRDAGLI